MEAHTTYGRLGIKVWIMKGEVYGKRELSPLVGLSKKSDRGGRSNSKIDVESNFLNNKKCYNQKRQNSVKFKKDV